MKLTHGSVQNVAEHGGFQAFDHVLDHSKKEQDGFIDNGKDAYGPGVYTWLAEGEYARDAVKNALRYTGEGDGGYVHFLSVDIEEDQLLNNLPADTIDEETWTNIIQSFMEKRRNDEGWCREDLEEELSKFIPDIEAGREIDLHQFYLETEQFGAIDMEYHNPNEASCAYEWQESILEAYDMEDPCEHIMEEGGPEGIASSIPERYDDLWSVTRKIWDMVAVNGNGTQYECYNKSFIEACLEHVDGPMVGAVVEEFDYPDKGAIFVVFDPSEITINKVLQVEQGLENDNGHVPG